jgi:hypothetical protein
MLKILIDEAVMPPAGAGGGSDHRQAGRASRAFADGASSSHGIWAQLAFGGRVDLRPRCCENGRADMVMITRVVMAARHVMGMAVRSVIGTVVGLSGKGCGAVLDRFDRRRCSQ